MSGLRYGRPGCAPQVTVVSVYATAGPECRLHSLQQFLARDRLGQKFDGPRFEAIQALLHADNQVFLIRYVRSLIPAFARKEDNGRVGRFRIGLQLPANLVSTQPRHHDVQDDEIGLELLGLFERSPAVKGRCDLESLLLQNSGDDSRRALPIIDDQDAGFRTHVSFSFLVRVCGSHLTQRTLNSLSEAFRAEWFTYDINYPLLPQRVAVDLHGVAGDHHSL